MGERSQTEEATYCMMPLVGHSGKGIEMENRQWLTWDQYSNKREHTEEYLQC